MSNYKIKQNSFFNSRKVFIITESVLFCLFIYMDLVTSIKGKEGTPFVNFLNGTGFLTSIYLKYYSIILCLIYSLYSLFRFRDKCRLVLSIAYVFTVISDYFLLLEKGKPMPGLISFVLVHCVYLYVICGGVLKKTGIIIIVRAAISFCLMLAVKISGLIHFDNDSNMNGLIFLVFLYGISFVSNIVRLFLLHIKNSAEQKNLTPCLFKNTKLFFIGLILFLLCDLNVLIYNLGDFLNIGSGFYRTLQNISEVLMWAFYLPSQVLIVLSGVKITSKTPSAFPR